MKRLGAALAVVALALAACGASSSGSATPDPALAFCPALETYATSLTALDAMVATSTVDEYKKAAADARTAHLALVAVAAPFAGAQLNTLQSAQADLDAAVAELDADATPADAEAALQDPLQAVIGQAVGTHNAICNTRPTPSSP